MNTYYFQGMRFIPHYKDFDYDDFEIEAKDEEQVWRLLDRYTKRSLWKKVNITYINGIKQ